MVELSELSLLFKSEKCAEWSPNKVCWAPKPKFGRIFGLGPVLGTNYSASAEKWILTFGPGLASSAINFVTAAAARRL